MVLCWVPYNFLFLLLRVWDITCPHHMISSTLNFGLVNYRNLGWIRSLRLNLVLFIFCIIMTIPVYVLQITEEFQAVNISVKTDIWRSEVRIILPEINSSWHFIVTSILWQLFIFELLFVIYMLFFQVTKSTNIYHIQLVFRLLLCIFPCETKQNKVRVILLVLNRKLQSGHVHKYMLPY